MKSIKKMLVIMSFILVFFAFHDDANVQAASISKTKVTLLNGQSVSLKVNGKKGKVKWYSSKKSVATVNSKGVVKAKKKGTAKITAKIGKNKYTCNVTVQTPKLSQTKLSLKYGKSYTLKLSGTNQKVNWSSSNGKVAVVSSKGKISTIGNGTAIITARVLGKNFSCKVTVSGKKQPKKFSEADARKNISITSDVIDGKLVVFFNSHYEWTTYIDCTCYYYDKNKNPVYVGGSDGAIVENGRQAVVVFNDQIEYSSYELRYKFFNNSNRPNEPTLSKYIRVSTRIFGNDMFLTFKSSYGKHIDGVYSFIKYYDSKNNLISVDTCWTGNIPANGYSISDVLLPCVWDEETYDYKNIPFSRYDIYISHVDIYNG